MAVARVKGVNPRVFDVIDYSVSENATPLIPGAGGGIPTMSLTSKALTTGPLRERNTAALASEVTLIDYYLGPGSFTGRGKFVGKNTGTTVNADGELEAQYDSILVAFNQNIKVEARFNPSETVASAFYFYARLVGIARQRIEIDPFYETVPFISPAWEGNAWEYMLSFCVAVGCELAVHGDMIRLQPPRTRVLNTENVKDLTLSTTSPTVADRFTVINYNLKRQSNRPIFTASNTYSVSAGGVTEAVVTYENSDLLTVNNPEAKFFSTELGDFDSAGQYVVCDARNNVVDPIWWRDNGGRILVAPGEEDNTLTITIYGASGTGGAPRSGSYPGPYTIGEYKTGELEASLVITGSGIFRQPEEITVFTGSPEALTEIQPEVIDNIFFGTSELAYSRGVAAATYAAGLGVRISGNIPFDITVGDSQEFGIVPGSRIQVYDNIFRIDEVSYSADGIDFSGQSDMLFSDVYNLYGDTFDEVSRRYFNLTFDQYNEAFPVGTTFATINAYNFPSFDDLEYIYEGVTFLEQSAYPYIKSPIYDGVPQTMQEIDDRYRELTFDEFGRIMPPGTSFRDLNRKLQ